MGPIMAATFAARGAHLHVRDLDVAAPAPTQAGLPAVTTPRARVASPADVERRFADLQRAPGGLEVQVDNAGIPAPTARAGDPVLDCPA